MSLALRDNIVKYSSTDTIRQVQRGFDRSPSLHRSSYEGTETPIVNWRESCTVLQPSVDRILAEAIRKGSSLVLEGVHVVPCPRLLERWRAAGGQARGVVLHIPDEDTHRRILRNRLGDKWESSGHRRCFDRIRAVQLEMVRLGQESDWSILSQSRLPTSFSVDISAASEGRSFEYLDLLCGDEDIEDKSI